MVRGVVNRVRLIVAAQVEVCVCVACLSHLMKSYLWTIKKTNKTTTHRQDTHKTHAGALF